MDWPPRLISNTDHTRSRQVPTLLPHQPGHMQQDNIYGYNDQNPSQYSSYTQPLQFPQYVPADLHRPHPQIDFTHQYHPLPPASVTVTSHTQESFLSTFDLRAATEPCTTQSSKQHKPVRKHKPRPVKKSKPKKKKQLRKLPLNIQLQLAYDEAPSMVASTKHLENQLQCPECPKRCTWDFQLQQHFRTHTGERPFVCSYCKKAFTRLEHKQRHERIHTGERPFKCEECGQCYRRKSQLTRHTRMHTDERPYKCPVCKKTFRRRGHLNRHVKLHKPIIKEDPPDNVADISEDTLPEVSDIGRENALPEVSNIQFENALPEVSDLEPLDLTFSTGVLKQ